jgi:hypothetical protein
MAYIIKLPDNFRIISDPTFLNAQSVGKEKEVKPSVRRPLRGTERKEDTYASIKIVSASKSALKLPNSSSPEPSEYYYNFMLQGYTEQRMEKSQIIETFGQSYVYFFGERTMSIQFQGLLLDTQDFNWKEEFLANYDKYFRGTKLVSKGYRAFIRVGDDLIGGYLSGMSVSNSTNGPEEVPFSFDLIVTDRAILETGSRNSTEADSSGSTLRAWPLLRTPAQQATKELGTFEKVLRSVQNGLTAFSEGVDAVLSASRAILLGRTIRVPITDFNQASDLQVRTTTVSLEGGEVSRAALLRGERVAIRNATPIVYSGRSTGKVTDNIDEYILPVDREQRAQLGTALLLSDVQTTPTSTDAAVRKFLKENGMSEIAVDGVPTWLKITGRVGYGVTSAFGTSIFRGSGLG